jgi:FkbM family methyltransferase
MQGKLVKVLGNITRDARRALAYRIYNWPQFPREPELESGTVLSYAAYGEDLVALAWLASAGVKAKDIRYLDVGASDPVVLSNTMLMYRQGASGVLVEPDFDMAQKLKERRTRDVVINAAAAFDDRRSAELIRFSSGVFNTFSEKQAEHILASSPGWGTSQRIVGRTEVRLMPINDIIEQNFGGVAPHFFSVDAESVDFEIVRSLDLARFGPWIICAEKSRPVRDWDDLLRPSGYHAMCETPHNIMLARDLPVAS